MIAILILSISVFFFILLRHNAGLPPLQDEKVLATVGTDGSVPLFKIDHLVWETLYVEGSTLNQHTQFGFHIDGREVWFLQWHCNPTDDPSVSALIERNYAWPHWWQRLLYRSHPLGNQHWLFPYQWTHGIEVETIRT